MPLTLSPWRRPESPCLFSYLLTSGFVWQWPEMTAHPSRAERNHTTSDKSRDRKGIFKHSYPWQDRHKNNSLHFWTQVYLVEAHSIWQAVHLPFQWPFTPDQGGVTRVGHLGYWLALTLQCFVAFLICWTLHHSLKISRAFLNPAAWNPVWHIYSSPFNLDGKTWHLGRCTSSFKASKHSPKILWWIIWILEWMNAGHIVDVQVSPL